MSTAESNFKGSFSVSLPMSGLTGSVDFRAVEIHQDIEAHDMAILTTRSRFNDYLKTLYPGTPILIDYRNSLGSSGRFVGYITKVDPIVKTVSDQYERRVTCVAASREFRNTARNVWRNRTAPEIVQDIGKKLGFKVVTKQHGLRRKHISQGGDTYWELLVKLAKMTGYVLRAEGTTLYFLPLAQMVKAFVSTAPVMADLSMYDKYRVGVLKVSVGIGNTSDDDEDLSDAAVVVGFGPNDKNPEEVREVPSSVIRGARATTSAYEKFNPGVVAHSRRDAQLLAKGMADRGMLAFEGKVEGQGDPLIAPYRPMYIVSKDKSINGYWIVKRVVHKIVINRYTCDVTVAADEISPQRSAPPAQRFRDLSAEVEQGFSPMVGNASRLRQLDPSFVVGKTFRGDSRVAQWVAV